MRCFIFYKHIFLFLSYPHKHYVPVRNPYLWLALQLKYPPYLILFDRDLDSSSFPLGAYINPNLTIPSLRLSLLSVFSDPLCAVPAAKTQLRNPSHLHRPLQLCRVHGIYGHRFPPYATRLIA